MPIAGMRNGYSSGLSPFPEDHARRTMKRATAHAHICVHTVIYVR